MDRAELWCRLLSDAKQNAEYQQGLQKLNCVEQDYTALLKTLTPQQREIAERYIAACEEMDEALVFRAYQLGVLDGSFQ